MRLVSGALVLLALAASAPARSGDVEPAGPPPHLVGARAIPPPAWIEGPNGATWLAYSMYCMRNASTSGSCVKAARQSCESLPQVVARRGDMVRVHLGFEPWVRPWRVDGFGTRVIHDIPRDLPRAEVPRFSYAFCVVRRRVAVAHVETTPLSGRVVAFPGLPCSDPGPCRRPLAGWLVAFALDGVRVASPERTTTGGTSFRCLPASIPPLCRRSRPPPQGEASSPRQSSSQQRLRRRSTSSTTAGSASRRASDARATGAASSTS